jgi:putative membrane protein insertion efficiency factor
VGLRHLPVRAAIFAVELYRTYVSPMRLPSCRFTPTCSQYAVEALSEYGLVRGGWLTTVRLAKCGPWHRGGWDPIPERRRPAHRHRIHRHTVDDAWGTSALGGAPSLGGESKSCV